MLDLIIVGGGPAGVAAGVYAARKYLKSALVAEEFGGQSTVSEGIENWIGTPKISGADLAKSLKAHLEAYKRDMVDVCEGDRAEKLEKIDGGFRLTTKSGKTLEAKAVLMASGASRRKLDIPGAEKHENKGLTYCASCDGPLFAGADVAVIGGGNAGFETAAQLLAYAKSVTLIHKHKEFKADPITVEKVLANPHMKAMGGYEPVEIKGDPFVSGLVVKNRENGESQELPVTGIFVEIGVLPNTGYAEGVVELDAVKRVVTNPKNQRAYLIGQTPPMASDARRGMSSEGGVQGGTTNERDGTRNAADEVSGGVWAAGDCTDELYHQNNIAAGDAVKALEDIYYWLKAR